MRHVSQKHKIISAIIAIGFVLTAPALSGLEIDGDVRIEMNGDEVLLDEDGTYDIDEIEVRSENVKFDNHWFNISTTDGETDLRLDKYHPDEFEVLALEVGDTVDSNEVDMDVEVSEWDFEELLLGERDRPDGETQGLGTVEDFEEEFNITSDEISSGELPFDMIAMTGGVIIRVAWEHQGEQATGFDVFRIEGEEFTELPDTYEEIDDPDNEWVYAGSRSADAETTQYEFVDNEPEQPDDEYCYTVAAVSLGGALLANDYECGSAFEAQIEE